MTLEFSEFLSEFQSVQMRPTAPVFPRFDHVHRNVEALTKGSANKHRAGLGRPKVNLNSENDLNSVLKSFYFP